MGSDNSGQEEYYRELYNDAMRNAVRKADEFLRTEMPEVLGKEKSEEGGTLIGLVQRYERFGSRDYHLLSIARDKKIWRLPLHVRNYNDVAFFTLEPYAHPELDVPVGETAELCILDEDYRPAMNVIAEHAGESGFQIDMVPHYMSYLSKSLGREGLVNLAVTDEYGGMVEHWITLPLQKGWHWIDTLVAQVVSEPEFAERQMQYNALRFDGLKVEMDNPKYFQNVKRALDSLNSAGVPYELLKSKKKIRRID